MHLTVEYSNPLAVYFPGTEVSGTVELALDHIFRASNLTVTLEGKAHTEWISSSQGNGAKAGGTLIYGAATVVLWSRGEGEEGLRKGLHRFPFRFLLPIQCPPSFEGMNGYVRYQTTVAMDSGWHFPANNKKPFSVVPDLDLNMNPRATNAIYIENSQTVGSPFSKKGFIGVTITCPKTGFVCGEEIQVSVSVHNESSITIKKAKLKLIQKVHLKGYLHAQTVYQPAMVGLDFSAPMNEQTMEERKLVTSAQAIRIDGNTDAKVDISLRVPAVVQSFNYCPLIEVEYLLKVVLKTSSTFNSSFKTEIPVIIGTVPISSTFYALPEKEGVPPSYSEVTQNVSGGNVTYKESVLGKQGTTKDMGFTEAFAPKYPFFEKIEEEE